MSRKHRVSSVKRTNEGGRIGWRTEAPRSGSQLEEQPNPLTVIGHSG